MGADICVSWDRVSPFTCYLWFWRQTLKAPMADQGAQTEAEWWTLDQVVGWVREIDPTASIVEIRIALERWCGLGRIGARGHRRHYFLDAVLPINTYDPNFVFFSEEHGRLQPWFDQISPGEWKDLAFFARPTLVAGEPYQVGLARALGRLDSPVELCSRSKYRLAWSYVEFCRDDVVREWAGKAAVGYRNQSLSCASGV
jgi:hypothetical protein